MWCVFLLGQLDTRYTCLMGLKVSIEKKVKAETIEYYILTSNKGFVGKHIIIYIIKSDLKIYYHLLYLSKK